MTSKSQHRIVLAGFTSSGKSTTGRRLAELLSTSFVDLDDIVEELHVKDRGHRRRCREIFSLFGRDCFVDYERQALEMLEHRDPGVIALGGGTPVDEENRRRIKRLGVVVYLLAAPEAVWARMSRKGFPRFLGENPTVETLGEYWRSRHEVYVNVADMVVDNTALTADETAEAVVEALSARSIATAKHLAEVTVAGS